MEEDRIDPGFSSTEYMYIQFVVGVLRRRTGWTLDLPLPEYSIPGVSLNSLPLLFACFLKENPYYLKGHCHEIFDFRLFLRISFPQAPAPLGPFRICSKIRKDIRSSSCTTAWHHWWQMKKIFY
jgi:hypothetical protein